MNVRHGWSCVRLFSKELVYYAVYIYKKGETGTRLTSENDNKEVQCDFFFFYANIQTYNVKHL